MHEMTSRPARFSLLFGAALALVASKAHAWGDEGHRVVGELGYRFAQPETRAALDALLTDPGYATLADAATWPDSYARRFPEYDPMKPFHYVNVDARAARYSRERDCPTGCIVTALEQHLALLASNEPPLTPSEQRFGVYWVAHLMGDLHQPLHVAHPDGRGGTSTRLRFFDAPDQKNAHWIWDFGLLERRPPPSSAVQAAVATDQPAYRALVDELAAELTPPKVAAHQRLLAPEGIANESLALSKRFAYLAATDHVNDAYEKTRWPVVKVQLARAGVRLAAVLDRALRATKSRSATP